MIFGLLVCSEHSFFNDDIKATCDICGKTIYYRPSSKDIGEKKVCTLCAHSLTIHDKHGAEIT